MNEVAQTTPGLHENRDENRAAIASLILGCVSLALFSTSSIGVIIAIPVVAIGLAMGIAGLERAKSLHGRGRMVSIIGLLVCGTPSAYWIVIATLGVLGGSM